MNRCLALLVFTAIAASGQMPLPKVGKQGATGTPAIVQTVALASATSSWAPTLASTTTGNWIAIQFRYNNDSGVQPTCTDALSTTYTLFAAASRSDASAGVWTGAFLGKPSGAITSVTCSYTGAGQAAYGVVREVSSLLSSSPGDQGKYLVSGGDTNWSSGATGTLAKASEIALGFAWCNGAPATMTNTSSGTWANSFSPATTVDGPNNFSAYGATIVLSATTAITFQGTASASAFCRTSLMTLQGQ